MPSAAALTVADRISDPMMPELDPSLLDFRPMEVDFSASKKDDPLSWNSQVFSDPLSVELGRHEPPRDERNDFDEDDMNIELDLDLGFDDGPSIEIGRKAPPPRDLDVDMMSDGEKFPNDIGYDENTRTRLSSRVPSLIDDHDDGIVNNGAMLLDDDETFALPQDNEAKAPSGPADPRLHRDSQSPLSSARSSVVLNFDDATNLNEDKEASIRQATHKAKRRKVIEAEEETMLTSTQMKQQQADRSAILKPPSFLSRDPVLLNLMNMQKNGEFVSSIMGDGRAKGWAPELKGILSIEVVRKAGELKRKRDRGATDVNEDDVQENMPQLQIPTEDQTFGAAIEDPEFGGDANAHDPSAAIDLPADDGFLPGLDDGVTPVAGREDNGNDYDAAQPDFDDTTAPLLNPMEQGAVSQGTKHAVHILRDRFGSSGGGISSQQQKASILFQNLLPEDTTSKIDATKMFFEVLVLATKDAIKVEQANQDVGSSLHIRAKRNLWSQWSEDQAGGEIAEQAAPSPLPIAS